MFSVFYFYYSCFYLHFTQCPRLLGGEIEMYIYKEAVLGLVSVINNKLSFNKT